MEQYIGRVGIAEALVEREDTAQVVGSGSLLVYATPCMAALMEGAACNCLEEILPEGQTSVGTMLNLNHLAATPVGLEVSAEAELTAVDGRKLTFKITAKDEKGIIGDAVHERFVVNAERFLQKTYEKI